MKVKNGVFQSSMNGTDGILDVLISLRKVKMNVSSSINLNKTIKNFIDQGQIFEQTYRDIFSRYGEIVSKDDGEQSTVIPDSNKDVFVKEMTEFLNTEIDIEVFPFKLPDDFMIEPEKLEVIEPFLV